MASSVVSDQINDQDLPVSAATQVFHLPELLELILLHLSTKDLLLTQRTSRSFRHTTQDSICLRRRLFLAPDWHLLHGRKLRAGGKNNRHGVKPENNCLLLRAFPGRYPTVTLNLDTDASDATTTTTTTGLQQTEVTRRGSGAQWSWDVCISFPSDGAPAGAPAVAYPEASWRKMYLSQPPCKALYLVRRWQRSRQPAMTRENGITMGDFVDEATAPAPGGAEWKWHQSYVSSDKDWHFEGNIKFNSIGE